MAQLLLIPLGQAIGGAVATAIGGAIGGIAGEYINGVLQPPTRTEGPRLKGHDKDGVELLSASTGVDADLKVPSSNYVMAGPANHLTGKLFSIVAVPRLLTEMEKTNLRQYVNGKSRI